MGKHDMLDLLRPLLLASPARLRYPRMAGSAPAASCIAIVDADDGTGDRLEAGLQTAGFVTEQIRLADFPDGRAALATLVARGVEVIVYDLGPRYRTSPALFEDLYAAIAEQNTPLLITTTARWLQEEQAASPKRAIALEASTAVQRLIRAIRHELREQRNRR
jgi:hypothetical protein